VPWDYAHTNAVEEGPDGDLLMSARNTWTVYEIDRETGAINWRLGGKRSDFKVGAGAHFAWQHDARWRSDGDAHAVRHSGVTAPCAAPAGALALASFDESRRPRHAAQRAHASARAARRDPGQASGRCPTATRWSAGARSATSRSSARPAAVLWNAGCRVGYETYRAYRMPWSGRPFTTPARGLVAAARRRD
jgi:hypothetical protein